MGAKLDSRYQLNGDTDKGLIPETLKVAKTLTENGFDFKNINLSKSINGEKHYFLLKELQQEGININKIIEEYNLDKKFPIGNGVTAVRRAYNGVSECIITDEEKKIAEELGLLRMSFVEKILDIATILNSNGIDFKTIQLSESIDGKQHHFLLKEIRQKGKDIKKIIKDNNLDPDYPIATNIYILRNKYRSSYQTQITREQMQLVEELGLIEETQIAKTLRITKILEEERN